MQCWRVILLRLDVYSQRLKETYTNSIQVFPSVRLYNRSGDGEVTAEFGGARSLAETPALGRNFQPALWPG